MAIRVLIADAQLLFADALGQTLAREEGLEVLEEHPTRGIPAIEAVLALRPDVALLDYWMNDTHGDAATRLILTSHPAQKVMLLSWFHGPLQIAAALDAGAVGFLPKSLTVAQVADGIRRAHAGECPVYGAELEQLARSIEERSRVQEERQERLFTLTPRELGVLCALNRGDPLCAVASDLNISQATVRNHIHSILVKTGTRSRMQAIALARSKGLLR